MTFRFIIFSFLFSFSAPLFMSAQAHAQRLCGSKVEQNNNVVRLLDVGTKTFCAINSSRACNIDFTATAPKDCKSGEVFSFRRETQSQKWSIVLQSLTELPDLTRMAITIDNNDPLEMPAEFLSHGPKKHLKEVHIDPRLTKVIVTDFQKAQQATIKITYSKDKIYSSTIDSDTLKAIRKSFKWVNCMQSMQ